MPRRRINNKISYIHFHLQDKTHNSVAYADANISSWNISYSRNEIFLPIYAIFFMLLLCVILFSLISEASNKSLSKQTLRL